MSKFQLDLTINKAGMLILSRGRRPKKTRWHTMLEKWCPTLSP